MLIYSKLIEQLMNAFKFLPGIGPKSAQRLVFFILQHGKTKGLILAKTLEKAINGINNCSQCRALCESEICLICSNPGRDSSLLCIVENPVDVIAIEKTNSYKGLYFVLMGHLSPIDGIGVDDIGIPLLEKLLNTRNVKEVILAVNPTIEGEATSYYLANIIKQKRVKCSKLARGLPFGSELDYIDDQTITRAISNRTEFNISEN